jgi:hypothetical protein
MLKVAHDILVVLLGFMVVVIVSDNSNLFAAMESRMIFPAFLVSLTVIGLKIQMKIN